MGSGEAAPSFVGGAGAGQPCSVSGEQETPTLTALDLWGLSSRCAAVGLEAFVSLSNISYDEHSGAICCGSCWCVPESV